MPKSSIPPMVVAAAFVALAAVSCQSKAPTAAQAPAAKLETAGKSGHYTFELELVPSPPKVGELFEVKTTVKDKKTGKPVDDAKFTLDATMPAHGHGMMTQPVHSALGGGRYLSKGMKLHMAGNWVFEIAAEGPAGADTASLPFVQPSTAVN